MLINPAQRSALVAAQYPALADVAEPILLEQRVSSIPNTEPTSPASCLALAAAALSMSPCPAPEPVAE